MKIRSRKGIAALSILGAAFGALQARRRTGTPYNFHEKSVLVTGGSRGLGLIMARRFADEGANIAIMARDEAELERAAADLRERGVRVITITGDVGKKEDADRAVERTVEEFGGIDVLVNNAGVIQVGPLDHQEIEDFENAMSVHFWGPLYTIWAARPHLKNAGEARIVNIASVGGKISVPHLLPYSASKYALVGLSDGLRSELVRDGIHVTTVSPGLMRTGSIFNALFKGKQKLEFGLFAPLGTLPLTAISAEEAARQIVEACRHGDPELTISWQAQLISKANALVPGVTARVLQLVSAALPKATGPEGNVLKTGWESRTPSLVHSPLVQSSYDAAVRNNNLGAAISPSEFTR